MSEKVINLKLYIHSFFKKLPLFQKLSRMEKKQDLLIGQFSQFVNKYNTDTNRINNTIKDIKYLLELTREINDKLDNIENDPAITIKALQIDNNLENDQLIDYLHSHRKYLQVFKELPDLKSPRKFNEKILYQKLYDRNNIYTILSDKLLVRDYVKSTIGEEYLVPLLWSGDNVDNIPYEQLPSEYYIKANHSWNMNISVNGEIMVISRNKKEEKFDKEIINSTLKTWLKYNLYFTTREWQYKNIKPMIIIEKFLGLGKEEVRKEFNFFCFDGTPQFFNVFSEKGKDVGFYDMNLNLLPINQEREKVHLLENRPENFDEMVEAAKKLSKGFSHVRIDFYNINDKKFFFGEYTFTAGNGMVNRYTEEWALRIGDMWKLQ